MTTYIGAQVSSDIHPTWFWVSEHSAKEYKENGWRVRYVYALPERLLAVEEESMPTNPVPYGGSL